MPQPMKFVVKCIPREEQEERKEWKAVPCSLGAETPADEAVFQFAGTAESNHMWCLRQGYIQFLVLPKPDMHGGRVKLGDRLLVAVRDMTSGAPSQGSNGPGRAEGYPPPHRSHWNFCHQEQAPRSGQGQTRRPNRSEQRWR